MQGSAKEVVLGVDGVLRLPIQICILSVDDSKGRITEEACGCRILCVQVL